MSNVKGMEKRWRRVNTWPIKGPILAFALLMGFLDHRFNWGRASFAAGVAMGIAILGFRDFWKEVKFWLIVVALALVQIVLVIELGQSIEQGKFPSTFAFGIVDCALVISAIYWCFSADLK